MTTKAQNRTTPLTVISFALVGLWLVLAAFPFIWTLWGSFKVQADFFSKADWTNAIFGVFTTAETGGPFTGKGYYGAWVQEEFWHSALNSSIVVFFTVCISLTFGTLGGYVLARSGFRYAFWILMAALVFRAMPHITLVSGYLPEGMADALEDEPAILAVPMGEGVVVAFADAPAFRAVWWVSQRLLSNAISFGSVIDAPRGKYGPTRKDP